MQINIEGMEGQTPYFVHWVGEHTTGGSDPLPWGAARVIVGSLPVPWETLADYPALELPYRMITPEGDDFYPEGWAIQLLVTKKQAGSFDVRLTCAVDAALPYFWRLGEKIRKRWPLAIVDGLPDADDGAGLPGKGATAVSLGFNLQTKPAGRKPDRLNDEAYQLLRTQGEQVAFAFWCEGKAIGEPTKTDRSNFKQSMDRAAGRAET